MAKRKIEVELYSYGLYSSWDRQSKDLPRLLDICESITIKPGIEFGCVIKIKGAKGKLLQFKIDHPPFKNKDGQVAPPFIGEYFINSNTYEFFLGDTVWEPYEDKAGDWELSTYIDGKRTSHKRLTLHL
jgi:hypothetical protein